jgi:hypothetical protein
MNNKGLFTSFVTPAGNTFNNIKNVATNTITNTANSIKNTANNIMEPIQESLSATMNETPHPFVSIPIILMLGVAIIALILIVIFRQPIMSALETFWEKVKQMFTGAEKVVEKPIPQFVPEAQFYEQGAMEKVLPGKKEVFNIAQDKYTYSDAEPLCKAFGAELATYDQVKKAWEQGADWCNYGWVKGQAALYPTQQSTFDKLQQGTEDQRMACGVPGVNGGYFDNPELRFGVNCYGVKPSQDEADIKNIMSDSGDLTPEALAFDRKVLNYKSEMGQIPVNPFKPGDWSS